MAEHETSKGHDAIRIFKAIEEKGDTEMTAEFMVQTLRAVEKRLIETL
jgi:hypothetical protein